MEGTGAAGATHTAPQSDAPTTTPTQFAQPPQPQPQQQQHYEMHNNGQAPQQQPQSYQGGQPPQQYYAGGQQPHVQGAPPPQQYYQQPPGAPHQYRPPPPQVYQQVGPPQPYHTVQVGPPSAQASPIGGGGVDNLAQVEKTIVEMQGRGMYNDPRYHQMIALANRLRAGGGGGANEAPPASERVQMKESEQTQFEAQVQVYRSISRQMPVTPQLAQKAMKDMSRPTTGLLPEPYSIAGQMPNGTQLPYNLMNILQLHQQRAQRITTVPRPVGIDPQTIMLERENRIANRMGERIAELESVKANVGGPVRDSVEIELRSLKLFNLQKQLRGEIVSLMRRDTTLETALNPNAYRRTKKQSLREARVTEKLEKQQKMAAERKRRERHKEFLDAVISHARDFKEQHKNNIIKTGKLRRAVINYHANAEKEKRKDEEKREKERMQKLMQEDEEGYRELLDKKKDRRLVYLLEQTDEYIGGLTNLVFGHQQSTNKVKKDERREARQARRAVRDDARRMAAAIDGGGENSNLSSSQFDMLNDRLHVRVRDIKTGGILHGSDAPTAQELDAWLEANPGYEVVTRDEDSSSSSESDDDEKRPHQREEKKEKPNEGKLPDDMTEEDVSAKMDEALTKARNEDDEYTRTANPKQTKEQQDEASYYMTAHAKQEIVNAQPSIMVGGTLKPYQVKGLEWLVSLYNNNLNGILADEMGLGKTIQTIALITYLMQHKKVPGPFLIIVPLSTISNWDMEFEKWGPTCVKITYKGNPLQRKVHQSAIRARRFNVLLTTYDYIIKDKAILAKIHWKYMIIDEGHRMKNHHNKLTVTLNMFYTAPHRLLLTGTPLQNKLPELWSLLNFLLPSIFKSCATFEQWFNAPFATTGEKVELNGEESMLVIRRLHKVLRPFLLRRLKKEVESQLPDKTEYLLKCDMSSLQKVLYESLKEGLLVCGNAQGMRSVMNTVMQLRKLCNHPFLFPEVEQLCRKFWKCDITGKELMRCSGKFELLDRVLPKLKAKDHRVLMFCQMTQLMTILEDFLTYRGYTYLRLDGSTNHEERGDMLKAFNAPGSEYFIFLLSTRAGGLGLNLQTADTVIIYDSDWNPHQDLQAQDRAHRIGQSKEVRVLRLMTVNSIEERILAAARSKLNMDSKVIQAGMFDNKSTGSDRKKFLENILTNERDDDDEENEVPDDDQINQMLARGEEEYNDFMSMDIDRRRAEATVGYPRKPRLIEDDEVPPAIKAQAILAAKMAAGELDDEASKKVFGQGKRQRKDVNYSADIMSEREWLERFTDEQVEDDEFLEDEGLTDKTPKPSAASSSSRKRRDVDDAAHDFDEQPTPKRGRGAKKLPVHADAQQCGRLYDVIVTLKSSDDRVIADPFMVLPTKRELPDYYERIDRPMDFKKIKKKIDSGKYRSLDEMGVDIHLLCDNAQDYNVDESLIYRDSVLLKGMWDEIRKRFKEEADKKATPVDEESMEAAPVLQQEGGTATTSTAPPAEESKEEGEKEVKEKEVTEKEAKAEEPKEKAEEGEVKEDPPADALDLSVGSK